MSNEKREEGRKRGKQLEKERKLFTPTRVCPASETGLERSQ
jgi:hypothetical protein